MKVSDDHEMHTLAGPYVMDAVTPDERESFVAHLADCAQCRDDVREMREATARLGIAALVRPRPELKEQIIRAAFRTSQLAPAAGTAPDGEPEVRPAAAAPHRAPPRRRRSIRPAVLAALASAGLVAAAATGFGLVMNSAMEQLHHSQRQDQMIATVLNARDAVMLTAKVTTGGTATVVMSHHEHRLVFIAHGLRPLPGDMGYELWLFGPAGERPAGMLSPASGGMAGPAVVSGLRPGDSIGVTVEPAGGSVLPSSVIVVMIHG
jgi:anti-sigma-K factor RskA